MCFQPFLAAYKTHCSKSTTLPILFLGMMGENATPTYPKSQPIHAWENQGIQVKRYINTPYLFFFGRGSPLPLAATVTSLCSLFVDT